MIDYVFSLNNIQDAKFQPKELEALEILAQFDNGSVQPNITATDLVFINEAAKYINDYIDGGTNGSTKGIFEGLDYEIRLMSENPPYNAFKGHLYLLNILRKCDEVKVKLVSDDGLNVFTEKCQALTFGYLDSLGKFPKTKLTSVPYVRNYIPDGMQLIMVAMSLYLMSKELYETVPKLPQYVTDIVTAAIPSVGIGVVVNVGNIIIQAVKLALLITYVALFIIAIIKMIDMLFSELYSIKRWFRACTINTLLTEACLELGYTFSSSLFTVGNPYRNLVFLPYKTKKGTIVENDSHKNIFSRTIIDDTGVPNSLGVGYTVYEMFELVKKMFNAKIIIKNKTVYLEPKNNLTFWGQNSNYILPDVEVLEKSYNTDELYPNYVLKFAYDIADMNTIDNFKGTNYERITMPMSVGDKTHLSFGGLQEVDFNVGRATRKASESTLEIALKSLAQVVDAVTSLFGFGSDYSSGFLDRKGAMQVSEHMGWAPKVMIIENKKIPTLNDTYISASYLYQTYHKIDSFYANNYGGQYEIYKDVIIPFCLHDFLQTKDCSLFKTANGLAGKFDKITWNFTQMYAKVDYRIQKPYTTNLKEIFIEPD